MIDRAQVLKDLQPDRDFFIGIDSDGCAFDTMEIKHKECFCPTTIKYFALQSVSKYAREAWEFVNLYSKKRGVNRFPALVAVLDLLRARRAVQDRRAEIAGLDSLRRWMGAETRLGNPALRRLVEASGDEELAHVLAWSEAVNTAVADLVRGVPPFPYLTDSLDRARTKADMMVVSSTPLEALEREWAEHDLARYVRVIAGQEHGSKQEHLTYAAAGKYPKEKTLMIGDAYGDLKAALSVEALFYPILPGREEASWQRFFEEGLERFFAGTYAGAYQEALMKELDDALPETPPWER